MNKQGLDLHITPFRSQNFQMTDRDKEKHNLVDFGFFSFPGAPEKVFAGVKNDYCIHL